MYNWHTVATGLLCPPGWKVPSESDWDALVSYMGAHENVGGKMREKGTQHWTTSGELIMDSFGFNARANGTRLGSSGSFFSLRQMAYWCTSTAVGTDRSYSTGLNDDGSLYDNMTLLKVSGMGVRCVKVER